MVRAPAGAESRGAVDGLRRQRAAESRDPIPTFTTYLRARHVLDDEKLKDVEARVNATIDEAVDYAMNAPDPKPDAAVTDLYA